MQVHNLGQLAAGDLLYFAVAPGNDVAKDGVKVRFRITGAKQALPTESRAIFQRNKYEQANLDIGIVVWIRQIVQSHFPKLINTYIDSSGTAIACALLLTFLSCHIWFKCGLPPDNCKESAVS